MITWDSGVSIFLFPFVSTDYSVFRVSSSSVLEMEGALMMDVMWCQRSRSCENIDFPHSVNYALGLPTQQNAETSHPLFLS